MSMDDLLRELQLEYIQSIPEKKAELTQYLELKDVDNLINCFHKLKGSGKTYGLDEVSILGQFFESWMREHKEKVLPFIATAVEILDRIYTYRKESKPYHLHEDPGFQKLNSIR